MPQSQIFLLPTTSRRWDACSVLAPSRISTWQALLTAPRRLRLHLRLHKTRKHRSQSSWHRRERGATLSPRLPAGTNSLPLAVNRFFRTLSISLIFEVAGKVRYYDGWSIPCQTFGAKNCGGRHGDARLDDDIPTFWRADGLQGLAHALGERGFSEDEKGNVRAQRQAQRHQLFLA